MNQIIQTLQHKCQNIEQRLLHYQYLINHPKSSLHFPKNKDLAQYAAVDRENFLEPANMKAKSTEITLTCQNIIVCKRYIK